MQNECGTSISEVLKQLDEWRHFPTYQLERRADIFIGLCLREILSKKFSLGDEELLEVIPEFPLRKGTLNPKDSENNQFYTTDFAVFSKCKRLLILVEIKTDNNSIKIENKSNSKICEQLDRLKTVYKWETKGVENLVLGVIKSARKSSIPHKFGHLISKLQSESIKCIPGSIQNECKDPAQIKKAELDEYLDKLSPKVCEDWKCAKTSCVLIYPSVWHENTSSKLKSNLQWVKKQEKCGWLTLIPFREVRDLLRTEHWLAPYMEKWAMSRRVNKSIRHVLVNISSDLGNI